MQDVSHIFRSYDVRGIVGKDLDEIIMERIGRAFAMHTKKDVIVARDVRTHSEALCKAFIDGVTKAGRNVTFLGTMPLGVGMFFAHKKGNYAYVTASHLPKEWNGVKFYHDDGVGFFENENNAIRDVFLENKTEKNGNGTVKNENTSEIIENYKKHLLGRIRPEKKMRITLDCGNGAAGLVARDLFWRAGFLVEALYERVDGNFPNRNPEPAEDPLTELRKKKGLGIAYDGDGDRMLLVYNGNVIQPEQAAYLILSKLLEKEKGPIAANIECTRLIDDIAKKFGRNVIRVPVGHTFLVQGVAKHGACFGVETSGHFVVPSIMPLDDSLAVSLYAASVISGMKVDKLLDEMPKYHFARVNFPCDDRNKFEVIDLLKKMFQKSYKNVSTMDGVRVDTPEGWVLIRASNTGPLIRMSIEAKNEESLQNIREEFEKQLKMTMTAVKL